MAILLLTMNCFEGIFISVKLMEGECLLKQLQLKTIFKKLKRSHTIFKQAYQLLSAKL